MTIEIRPMGVACNIACDYCYQEPQRLANGNNGNKYDLDKIFKEIDRVGQFFSLFGGEALLIPKKDLEKIWKYGYEKFGKNSIQTNGTLIDDDHINLFKKYNVNIGISIDGPNELNQLRKSRGKIDKTDEMTKKTMDNIKKLRDNNISVGIIITIHRVNASPERLPRLLKFMRWLGDIGIKHGNIHSLEVDSTMPDQEKNVLSQKENAEAFIKIAEFLEENKDLKYNPFIDIENLLLSKDDKTICIWNRCDPMNTQAVYGIEGDGALSNCGRTNKEGIDFYKADGNNYSRYISLYNTPQDMGGCKDCKFMLVCGGSCPGESQNGDFRNKTIHCYTQKKIIGFYEQKLISEGKEPITTSSIMSLLQHILIRELEKGNNPTITQLFRLAENYKKEVITVPVKKGE